MTQLFTNHHSLFTAGGRIRPLVWYMTTGYGLPAGIEAHILHYATEMRNHGFDTRVVVFKPLPQAEMSLAEYAEKTEILPRITQINTNENFAEGGMAREAGMESDATAESQTRSQDIQEAGLRSPPPASDSRRPAGPAITPSPAVLLRVSVNSVRDPLPRHRFLVALEDRGIPIMSLYDAVDSRARLLAKLLYVPWRIYRKARGKGQEVRQAVGNIEHRTSNTEHRTEHHPNYSLFPPEADPPSADTFSARGRSAFGAHYFRQRRTPFTSLSLWSTRKLGLRLLKRMLAREKPAVIHVFGRLPMGAWGVLPPEKTIFHEMMTGTVDACWNEEELAEFRGFAARCARIFAPGGGVAENMKREFGITREIVPIFTMCPDER